MSLTQTTSLFQADKNRLKDWQVYLITCSDRTLYCGVTKNIDARLEKHNQGKASKYTRSRLPVKLAAVRKNLTKSEAFKLEHQIKKLPAREKIPSLENGIKYKATHS